MFGTEPIDDSLARMAAIRAALKTAMPGRVHKTSYRRDIGEHDHGELRAGVVMLVVGQENDFSDLQGLEAREGTLSVALVFHCRVEDDDAGEGVEAVELGMCAEIKNFVRAGVAGIDLTLETLYQSAQQDTPFGFVVAQLSAGPPRTNVN